MHDVAGSLDEGEDPAVLEHGNALDLQAFSSSAAQLSLHVRASYCVNLERPCWQRYLLPGLRALVGTLHRLHLCLDVDVVVDLLPFLAELQLKELRLSIQGSCGEWLDMQPITMLPACSVVGLQWNHAVNMTIMWSALCSSPGVRHRGSLDEYLTQEEGPVHILGCTGLPDTFPLAIMVWGDLSMVHGVPRHEFVPEATHLEWRVNMWVWRSATAADLKI